MKPIKIWKKYIKRENIWQTHPKIQILQLKKTNNYKTKIIIPAKIIVKKIRKTKKPIN